jgi:predicted DNA-binding protein
MEARDAVLVRLPIGLKERLEQMARDHRRSANMEIQVAIEAHLAQSKKIELR